MKYTEIKINKHLFGADNIIYNWEETDREIKVYIKTKSRSSNCPSCGNASNAYHATYKRVIQSVPIRMKTTYLHVTAYKYNCTNVSCAKKVFMENLPYAPSRKVRTSELESVILCVSIFLSNEGASNVLGMMGIKVSGDTIKRIYNKMPIEPEENIEAIGIDDVALRKGHSYATAIYDLSDHHLVALLAGRDAETVKAWLKTHTKIKTVARDRASAYASAVSEILPDCTQVADRFHLIANLIEKMRDIFKAELPAEILIKDGEVQTDIPEKIKTLRIDTDSKRLGEYNYDNSIPRDGNGSPVTYDKGTQTPVGSTRYRTQVKNRKKNRT